MAPPPSNQTFRVPESEIEFQAHTAQGAGGQNVNKVASALHLFFDIRKSSLPEEVKQRLLARPDQRITREGVLVLRSQEHRTQERNREAALQRLHEIIQQAARRPKTRKPSRPTRASKQRRLQSKAHRSETKRMRKRPDL